MLVLPSDGSAWASLAAAKVHTANGSGGPSLIELLATAPFAVLLVAIAVLPLIPRTAHWWEHNDHRLLVAGSLAGLTISYYLWRGDPDHSVAVVLSHALLEEYIPFIVLLFSLYTICGGIRVTSHLPASPLVNTAVLALGASMASFVGTTGASMLLIRPLLEINAHRRRKVHTVVFFIFLVSNIGGCLLPIGDPPLFLGYLAGVPFLWTLGLAGPWAFCVVSLLVVYAVWDTLALRGERANPPAAGALSLGLSPTSWPAAPPSDAPPLRIEGAANFLWLAVVVAAVATVDGGPHPQRPLPILGGATPAFFRELILLSATLLAWLATRPANRRANRFNFLAIGEVAALFVGIFVTMQPALELLGHHGPNLGLTEPRAFFWATGGLSGVLDNAPTYAVFLRTAASLHGQDLAALHSGPGEPLLVAISLGAVFMGALTYIGNGPNFMVKSLAESSGVVMPSFFGYGLYSAAILVPLFMAVSYIFL